MHERAIEATKKLRGRGESLSICSQNVIEFWGVATRPLNDNGLGMTSVKVLEEIRRLESFFPMLPDTSDIYREWRSLVTSHEIRGVAVHDARLVAVMIANQATHLLTFNTRDFRRYSEIVSVHPTEIR